MSDADRRKKLQQKHDERMDRIMREIDAADAAKRAPTVAQLQDVATARADILQLCSLLASVQCINTVQEVRSLRSATRTIQARWGIKEVQP